MFQQDVATQPSTREDAAPAAAAPGRSSRVDDDDAGSVGEWADLSSEGDGGGDAGDDAEAVAPSFDSAPAAPAEAGNPANEAGDDTGGEQENTATKGFSGRPVALPFRAEMEKSFGVSFAHVKAYTDENAQAAARSLGAEAFTVGNRIAFDSPSPRKAVVAHELTHVLQHSGGRVQAKSADGGSAQPGIETAGEAEAEQVEQAVDSGKPARGALAAETPRVVNAGAQPQRKPNLKSKFASGMTFSRKDFEHSHSYELWSHPGLKVPVGPAPGLFFTVEPSVNVKVGAGVEFDKRPKLKTNATVNGNVDMGFEYGVSQLAAVRAAMGANLHGGFTYEREAKGDRKNPSHWKFWGGFALGTAFKVGVKIAGGLISSEFEFGRCDIGRLTGLEWENGKFNSNKIGWTWGPKPQSFFRTLKAAINKAKKIVAIYGYAPKKAAETAWKGVKLGLKGAQGVVKVADKIGDFLCGRFNPIC